jgi:hypothetical protein
MENEQVQYVMRSRWVRNRSKYMIFHTIREGAVEHTNLCANLLFLLFNAPTPTATLRCSLVKWVAWKYLVEMPNGGYALTSKGRSFLRFMEKKHQFITDDWYKDLVAWRSVPKDNLKDVNGNWLPQAKFIKAIEAMRWHRMGTKRRGTRAGRPALYNHCPVCHASYALSIPQCPLCRIKAEQAARMPSAATEQAATMPAPATPAIITRNYVPITPPECPRCHCLLSRGVVGKEWICGKCYITVWPNKQC